MQENIPFFRVYHRLHHLFFQCISKMMSNPSVHPGQAALLTHLLGKDSVSQGELCRTLGVSAAAVAVSLRRLEQQGFLSRQQNPSDLRENILSLTPLGEKTAAEIRDAVEKAQDQAILGFSPEEMAQLVGYLSRIAANLHASKESNSPNDPPTEQGE